MIEHLPLLILISGLLIWLFVRATQSKDIQSRARRSDLRRWWR